MRIKAIHISSTLFTLLGLFVVLESRRLKYWSDFGPGPGFLPFWLGISISIMAFLLLVKAISNKSSEEQQKPFYTGWRNSKKAILTIAAYSALTFFVNLLGFYFTGAVFILFIIGLVERRSWFIALAVMALSLIGFYYIFSYLLNVQLPEGFLRR